MGRRAGELVDPSFPPATPGTDVLINVSQPALWKKVCVCVCVYFFAYYKFYRYKERIAHDMSIIMKYN